MINHPNRRRTAKIAVSDSPVAVMEHDHHEREYEELLLAMQANFNVVTAGNRPLFQTDASQVLWDAYLKHLRSDRQYHNCNACRHFIKRFGGLVVIDAYGKTVPVVWPEHVPGFYGASVNAMYRSVSRAKITRPFYPAAPVLGTPVTGKYDSRSPMPTPSGTWTHFSVDGAVPWRNLVRSPEQVAAAKLEDFHTVQNALAEYPLSILKEALRVLDADAVNRAEKFAGPVRWLIKLHEDRRRAGDSTTKANILWQAVATAPEGFCHIKSSVIGSLLYDIQSRLPFETVRTKFNALVHPLRYQRPQTAPKAQNIVVAERLVEKLGIARSLERRFARLDEIETIWKPQRPAPQSATDGVFGHIRPKNASAPAPSLNLPPATMTWEKFARTVLPTADSIEMMVPRYDRFVAILTAVHDDAPPILAWDYPDQRNPFSSYMYHNGSSASQWRLTYGWTKVNAISLRPNMWHDRPMAYHGEGVIFILDRALDTAMNVGNALFPEIMRPELHEVRATIEAFSKTAQIHGRENGSACGLAFGKGVIDHQVRVLSGGRWQSYHIDRWD